MIKKEFILIIFELIYLNKKYRLLLIGTLYVTCRTKRNYSLFAGSYWKNFLEVSI